MAEPQPLPIRVLVKGASLMHDMSELPQTRSQYLFARELEDLLLLDGYGADIWTAAVASQPMAHAFRTWEEQVKAWAPDVVLLSYGYYECVHLLLPRWLERHSNSLKAVPGPIRRRYRQWLLRPLWKVLAKTQQKVDRIVGARGFGPQVRKFETQLAAYVRMTLEVGAPLVVLFEFIPPGARGKSWFPGMAARAEMMNGALRRVSARFADQGVVLLPIPALLAEHMPTDEPWNADGFHYGASAHQIIGDALATLVKDFVADQPRLQPRSAPAAIRAIGS